MTLLSGKFRLLAGWRWDNGAEVSLIVSGDIPTEEALDMIETLIPLKRAELDALWQRPQSLAPTDTKGE